MDRAADLLESAGRMPRPVRLKRLQQDLAMARHLEEIYSQPKDPRFFSGREQDGAYARAFRDYGVDLAALTVAEAAERIQARSIRLQLARALDFWSSMRRRAGNEDSPE